jgi:hypothetical protein
MKKLFIAAITVLAFGSANAQNREKGTTELTPFIGYSSSNYYGEDINNSSLGAVAFGVDADYFFNDRWSLRSGLLYQTMGTTFRSYEEKVNYLTIPVNANWHFGSTRKWNLNFGPSVGFLMSAKDNDGTNLKEYFETTQIGLNYGIGYKIFVNENISVLIDYQGMTGLSKIDKSGNTNLKNMYGTFNVGGAFHF